MALIFFENVSIYLLFLFRPSDPKIIFMWPTNQPIKKGNLKKTYFRRSEALIHKKLQ